MEWEPISGGQPTPPTAGQPLPEEPPAESPASPSANSPEAVKTPGETVDTSSGEPSAVLPEEEYWLPRQHTAEAKADGTKAPGFPVQPPPVQPGTPDYTAVPLYGYGTPPYRPPQPPQVVGFQPVGQPLFEEHPLPPYRELEPDEQTETPKMITAVSPLSRQRLLEIEKQTQPPFWPMAVCVGVLLTGFSLSAISVAAERSIPGGIATACICIGACIACLVLMILAFFRGQREQQQMIEFAAGNQEADNVIEVYADRAVKITPRSRTVVYLRRRDTTLWESPQTITISDGYAAIVWQAEDLTVPALERLRNLLYAGVKPDRRKSSGRLIATAATLSPLPDIQFSEDTLCSFRYQPDRRRETDRQIGILTARTLPFNAVGAVVGGALLAGLYPLSMPMGLSIVLFCVLLLMLMQGFTTIGIWYFLRRANALPSDIIGVAFTENGMAVEEKGCLRFIPRGAFKSLIKKNMVALQTPVGQLCIPWEAIPDPDLVKRLLMLGD